MKKAAVLQLLVAFCLLCSTANAQVVQAGNTPFNYTAAARVDDTNKEKATNATAESNAAIPQVTKQHLNLLPQADFIPGSNKTAGEIAETNNSNGNTKSMAEELEAWVANELILKKSRRKLR
ncbi:hypothetical protein [Pontibacter vulgaris]|uniref:hypothetical protein n=1 Tax=Pontibacter vulgaris TaxID=2905679 RepID=UPI001FA6CBC9|nr:hypothetical protein [Pontibacter vulgaris]